LEIPSQSGQDLDPVILLLETPSETRDEIGNPSRVREGRVMRADNRNFHEPVANVD